MSVQKNLDKIINKYGFSRYEKVITSGIEKFIESCSESIRENVNDLNDYDLQNLLYLMKYLYQNWSNSERTARLNKQLCFKALFVIILSGKQTLGWRQLLKQVANQIAENWEISPNEYPFLTEEEKDKISSSIDIISQQDDINTKFLSLKFKKTVPEPNFSFSPNKIYNEFIETYKIFCRYPEEVRNNAESLKAIFIAVKEQNITKAFPAILKTLPLHFCTIEINRLLSQIQTPTTTETENGFLSEKKTTLALAKKLFIKGENSEDYKPIPVWAEWFFQAGQKIAMLGSNSDNITIGFSLPTRAYAGLFFLLGYETWNAEKMMQEHGGNELHFNRLSKCEQDEALLIWANNHWKRCWFKGVAAAAGEKCITVEVPGAERRQYKGYISEANIAKLRKAVDPEREVAPNQLGFEMSGFDSLVSYYNKRENDILQFLTQEKLPYYVIGNISALKKETEQEKLYVQSTGEYTEISFQHILRFKNFMTDFDLPRGIILRSQQSLDSHTHVADTVVYDGSLAFLNCQGDISGNMEIVFLDRTEPQFSSACGELMTRYYNREDDVYLFDKIPASVELVAFKE